MKKITRSFKALSSYSLVVFLLSLWKSCLEVTCNLLPRPVTGGSLGGINPSRQPKTNQPKMKCCRTTKVRRQRLHMRIYSLASEAASGAFSAATGTAAVADAVAFLGSIQGRYTNVSPAFGLMPWYELPAVLPILVP